MGKQTDGPTISDDSIGFLQDAKKGKVRKFAMICKGTSVVSLIIYKKGNVEKRKKEAKEAGKGQFYFGTVDGSGSNIRFVLARSDGFESEPVKTTVLKGFLEEAADFKCKPYFEIVDSPQLVLDEDDPLVIDFQKLQTSALTACEAHPEQADEINRLCLQIGTHFDQDQSGEASQLLEQLKSLLNRLRGDDPAGTAGLPPAAPPEIGQSNSADDLASRLTEGLKNLKPLLERAVAASPEFKAELIASFSQVRDQIKNRELDAAQTNLAQLEQRLSAIVDARPAAEVTGGQAQPATDGLSDWKSKLAAWLPAIKAAIGAKGPHAAAMVQLLSEASTLSKSEGQLAQAVIKLSECYELATQPATASAPDLNQQFNARLKVLLPQVKAITNDALKEQSKSLILQAGGLAQKKEFDEANRCLDNLESMLAAGAAKEPAQPSTSKPPRGIVAYTKLLLDWRKAQAQVLSNLSSIANALLSRDDVKADPRFEQVRAAAAAMPELIPAFGEELGDLIDAAMTAGPGPRADECLRNAKVVLKGYRQLLRSAVALQRLEQLAAKHTNAESNVYSLLDATLAALEQEFDARTA